MLKGSIENRVKRPNNGNGIVGKHSVVTDSGLIWFLLKTFSNLSNNDFRQHF